MSPDTQAALLLCGHFKDGDELRPLTASEYNRLAKELIALKRRPADLIQGPPIDVRVEGIETQRITALLRRGAGLALALEHWEKIGITVFGRSDPEYPRRLKARLKAAAPPLMYCAGLTTLAECEAICVVGSRDATDAGLQFAQEIGRFCAENHFVVVSGDARGVDRTAMDAAIDQGGFAIGILAESLGKAVLAKRNRTALMDGHLALLSPFSPDAMFTVSHAMERNKYLYAMSIAAIIADSDVKGGTWTGALENQENGWVPAFVRIGEHAKDGNKQLATMGLKPLTSADLHRSDLAHMLRTLSPQTPTTSTPPLLASPAVVHSASEGNGSDDRSEVGEVVVSASADQISQQGRAADRDDADSERLFKFFLNQLLVYLLGGPHSANEIAEHFELDKQQAKKWLMMAEQKLAVKKSGKPARYNAAERSLL